MKESWALPNYAPSQGRDIADVDVCLVHVMDYIVGIEMEGCLNVESSHYPTFQALKAIREKVMEHGKAKEKKINDSSVKGAATKTARKALDKSLEGENR